MWSKKYSDTHHQPLKEVLSPFLVYIQVLTSSICHYDTISLIRNHNGIAMVFISNWNPVNVLQFHIILFYKDPLLESKPNVTSLLIDIIFMANIWTCVFFNYCKILIKRYSFSSIWSQPTFWWLRFTRLALSLTSRLPIDIVIIIYDYYYHYHYYQIYYHWLLYHSPVWQCPLQVHFLLIVTSTIHKT